MEALKENREPFSKGKASTSSERDIEKISGFFSMSSGTSGLFQKDQLFE